MFIESLKSNKVTPELLKALQELPLEKKIEISNQLIELGKETTQKPLMVAFSGGKDSSVLLDLVRSKYPDTPAVFSNTTNEDKRIIDFVKNTDNVEVVYPKKTFTQILQEEGYPLISKEFSEWYSRLFLWVHKNPTNVLHKSAYSFTYLYSKTEKKANNKFKRWLWLLDSKMFDYYISTIKEFCDDEQFLQETLETYNRDYKYREKYKITDKRISIINKCCDILKKRPMNAKELKKYLVVVGTMTAESRLRKTSLIKNGFLVDNKSLTPIFFWLEKDIWDYIKTRKLEISTAYETEKRTGCVVCGFGLPQDTTRIERAKEQSPKRIDKLLKVKNQYSDITFGELIDIIIDFSTSGK